MSSAKDIRAVITRLDAAIAAGESYGRVDLDRLRRELTSIESDVAGDEDRTRHDGKTFAEMVDEIDQALGSARSAVRRGRNAYLQAVQS